MFLVNGKYVPDECVKALDDLELTWPGSTLEQARGAIVSAVLRAYVSCGDQKNLATADLIFRDRKILPISERKFGVVVTEEESISLPRSGYKVITLPVPSRRKKDDALQHHIEVHIAAHDLEDDKREARFDIPLLETVGRASVVVSPLPWKVGSRHGVKAYAKSIEIGNK